MKFIVLLFLLVSCVNDRLPKAPEFFVKLNLDTQCFSKIGEQVPEFLAAKLSDSDSDDMFGCVVDSMAYFERRFKSQNKAYWTQKEIGAFLKRFVGGADSEPMVNKIFKTLNILKPETKGLVLKKDFKAYHNLFKVLKKLFRTNSDLVPWLALVSKDNISKKDHQRLNELSKKLFNIIGHHLEELDFSLDDERTQALFKLWLPGDDNKFRSYIQGALRILKNLHPQRNADGVYRSGYWKRTGSFGQKLYRLYFDFRYKFNTEGWYREGIFEDVQVWAKNIIKLGETSLESKSVSQEEFAEVLLGSVELGMFNPGLKGEQKFWSQWLIKNLVEDNEITPLNWKLMSGHWAKFEEFEKAASNLKTLPLVPGYLSQNPVLALDSFSPRTQAILRQDRPLFVNSFLVRELSHKPAPTIVNGANSFRLNWQRALVDLLFDVYKTNQEDLDVEAVTNLYALAFRFLNKSQILGDDEQFKAFRIFNETNLFLPGSKPDKTVSFVEALEYLVMLFSSVESLVHTRDGAVDQCNFRKDPKCVLIKNAPKTKYQSWFRTFGAKKLANFKGHFSFYKNNDSAWGEFWCSFEVMGQAKQDCKKDVVEYKTFELVRALTGMQYSETLFQKFDSDRSGTINDAEAIVAFEAFKEGLKSLPQVIEAGIQDDEGVLLAVFTYLIKEGRFPTESDVVSWSVSRGFCGFFSSACDYEVDRAGILKVFKELAVLTEGVFGKK